MKRISLVGVRRSIAIAVAVVTLSLLFTPTLASADGVNRLRSLAAWKAGYDGCVWAPNASSGAQLQLYDCNGSSAEQWNIITVGFNRWILQNQYSALCLDIWRNSQANGTSAVQWPCSSQDQAQVFLVAAYGNSGCPYGETSVIVENQYNARHFLDDWQAGHARYNAIDFYQQNGTDAQSWCLA